MQWLWGVRQCTSLGCIRYDQWQGEAGRSDVAMNLTHACRFAPLAQYDYKDKNRFIMESLREE